MMRRPTPSFELMAWHMSAMRGENPSRIEDEPQCGWYRRRMVKGGPFVPVKIWLEQDIDADTGELLNPEIMRATVNGQPASAVSIWTYCQPISRDQFEALEDAHASTPLMAATLAVIDLSKTPIGPRSLTR